MIYKKIIGYILPSKSITYTIVKGRCDTYKPSHTRSVTWKDWQAILDDKTCIYCSKMHGKIYHKDENPPLYPEVHPNCRCVIDFMKAVMAGYATKDGRNGSDWWMKYVSRLPDYYISLKEAKALGWNFGKPLKRFAPNKMLAGGIYKNDNGHLPWEYGRIWYEADINYYEGHRNGHRLVWSNDGLMFVTFDHYRTYYEVI